MIASPDQCDWSRPGLDPYTGTPRAAIERMHEIPRAVRAVLIARVDRHDYDDVVLIDRESIRSQKHDYSPGLRSMSFGPSKVCDQVTREGWAIDHVESAWVYCDSGWCIAMPAVCRNWTIITRLERTALVPPAYAEAPIADTQTPDSSDARAVLLAAVESSEGSAIDATSYGAQYGAAYAAWPAVGGGYYSPSGDAPCCAHCPPLDAPVTPVPEPTTAALLLLGVAAVAWRRHTVKNETPRS